MIAFWTALLWISALCAVTLTVVAALAPFHAVAAILNNLLLQVVAASLAVLSLCIVSRRWRPAFLSVLALAGQAAMMAPGLSDGPGTAQAAPDDGATLRLISYNAWLGNAELGQSVDFLRREAADVVVLNEVGPLWADPFEALSDLYPHRLDCLGTPHCHMAILSRLPLTDTWRGRAEPGRARLFAATVQVGDNPLRVMATHLIHGLVPGGFARQGAQVAGIARHVVGEPLPVVLAGDFNMAPWAPRLQDLAAVTGMAVAPGLSGTWPAAMPVPARIPIDHVLVDGSLRVLDRRVGPDLGSDHRPVIVIIGLAGG